MRKENSFDIKHRAATKVRRAGFTLTEMLVAVGLMLLVMSLFAEIFSLAVTTMTTQIGLANNNQRARTAFIVIDNDLKRMSYRALDQHSGIVPLVPGLKYNGNDAGSQQQGYIYYSENNPLDDTDDILQFTIYGHQSNNRYPEQNVDYYGKARLLSPSGARDQPDWDDGTNGDNVSISQQAEVVYFLRHGTLYRRTVLLRDATHIPNSVHKFDGSNAQKIAQPAVVIGGVPIDLLRSPGSSPPAPVSGYAGNFYSDFDYSAHFGASPYDSDLTPPPPPGSPNLVAILHGSLSNTASNNWPLGVPHFRFGFHPDSGRPREYFVNGSTDYFFGRYTHEETSNTNFQYPSNTGGNVFNRNDFDVNFYLNTGRLDVFANGARRGTDILMNNVQSFDVEIWDERAGQFVDIGASESVNRDFSTVNNLNVTHGPIKPNRIGPLGTNPNEVNVFDTWHSVADINTTFGVNDIGSKQAPYVPKKYSASFTTNSNYNWQGEWKDGWAYFVNDLVVPTSNFITNNPQHALIDQAVIYRCVASGTSGALPADEPVWPADTIAGQIPDGGGTLTWEPIDNRKEIKALRIIIRFRDPNSDQMRQMTMVHSFNEKLDE